MFDVNTIKTVKKGNKLIIKGGFNKAYRLLPYVNIREARSKITDDCNWSRSTFDKKMRGQTPFTLLEITYLAEYFTQHNINAWTGESLNRN